MNDDNIDVHLVKTLAGKIAFTPSMSAIDLIDELDILSKRYPNDYTFGLIIKSIIFNTHENLKMS